MPHAMVYCVNDYHHKEGTYSRYISCIYDHNKVKFKFKCYSFALLCGRLTERQQHKQEWPQTGCNTYFVHCLPLRTALAAGRRTCSLCSTTESALGWRPQKGRPLGLDVDCCPHNMDQWQKRDQCNRSIADGC